MDASERALFGPIERSDWRALAATYAKRKLRVTMGPTTVLALLWDLDAAEARAAALEAALGGLVLDHHPPVTDRGDCYYCGLPAGHTSDCPWEQARAALAATEPKEGER